MKKYYLLPLIFLLAACDNIVTPSSSSELSSSLENSSSTSSESSLSDIIDENALNDAMLQQIANNLYLEGQGYFDYVNKELQDDNYTSTLQISFNDNSFVSYEKTSLDVVYSSKIVKRNNNPYTYFVNENNELEYVRVENSSRPLTWADFTNPFKTLTADKFSKTSNENEYMLKNASLVNSVSKVITGYPTTFKTFKIKIEDKQIKTIEIVGSGQDAYFVDLNLKFVLEVKDLNKTNEAPSVYTRSSFHDNLDEAFDNTLKTSFTVIHTDHHEEYGDTTYKYYFTDNAIYCDRKEVGDETYPFGYVVLDDGVYKFSNILGEGLRKHERVGDDLKAFYPKFKNFNSTIIKPIDENNFENYDSDNASIIGKYIAENSEETMFTKAANSLKISLKDKKLDKIIYYYSILGGFTHGEVTMEFVDYGTTSIPLDFTTMKDAPLDDE